jgi:hypothetical protein
LGYGTSFWIVDLNLINAEFLKILENLKMNLIEAGRNRFYIVLKEPFFHFTSDFDVEYLNQFEDFLTKLTDIEKSKLISDFYYVGKLLEEENFKIPTIFIAKYFEEDKDFDNSEKIKIYEHHYWLRDQTCEDEPNREYEERMRTQFTWVELLEKGMQNVRPIEVNKEIFDVRT